MKLYPLNPEVALNLQSFQRKHRANFLVLDTKDESLSGIILLGDGTPDDWVAAVLAVHHDGAKIFGIVKPRDARGVSTLSHLRSYVGPTRKTILAITDLDRSNSADLFNQAEEVLSTSGIIVTTNPIIDWVRHYVCNLGSRRFNLFLILNGRGELNVESHSIEDHLLRAAYLVTNNEVIRKLIDQTRDSKIAWQSLRKTDENIESEVYRKLLSDRNFMEEIFIQHSAVFDTLNPK